LADSFNYKIAVFAVFLIQTFGPREYIENVLQSKYQPSVSNSNIITFISMKENYWMSDKEIEELHTVIREKIIFDIKFKNTFEKENFPTVASHIDMNDKLENLKIDEINDYMETKVPDIRENNLDKKKEENLSLEELGVFEVEDEIFENFDEENIPVIKNIYKRKKGSAEKLKTNQTTRNLLMSNMNKRDENNQIVQDNEILLDTQLRKSIFYLLRKHPTSKWSKASYSTIKTNLYKKD
jgi:hypothetical protein